MEEYDIWYWLRQDIRFIFYKLQYLLIDQEKLNQKDREKFVKYYPKMEKIISELETFYANIPPKDISIQERKEKNLLQDNTFVYGETPWLTIISILNEIKIKPEDVFYELGCGTGRLCFFLNQCFKIKTVGFDRIGYFINVANTLVKKLNLKDITFINDNFLNHNISEGTIFYLTPTCYSYDMMKAVNRKIKECKSGSKIISISRHLNSPYLKRKKTKIYRFSWYMARAFFYEVE